MSVKIHIQGIHDTDTDQCQYTGIDKCSTHTSDHEIVCDQKVRLSYDLHDSAKDLIHRLHKQTHHNKIQRKQRQDQKAFLF